MRMIAIIILLIPGILSAVGIKLMRDSFFNEFTPLLFHPVIQFIVGFILFAGGLLFLGGFVVYRDRKKNNKLK
ncbi:MAG TPA: DUF2627 family protein [Candidatus Avamphibacillus intestinigallinarum]|nr:DUF2627 family protein [Candidatus Avamphibacillus intestinigallinarum]